MGIGVGYTPVGAGSMPDGFVPEIPEMDDADIKPRDTEVIEASSATDVELGEVETKTVKVSPTTDEDSEDEPKYFYDQMPVLGGVMDWDRMEGELTIEDGTKLPERYWRALIPEATEAKLVGMIEGGEIEQRDGDYPAEIVGSTVMALLFLGNVVDREGKVPSNLVADVDLNAERDIILNLSHADTLGEAGDGRYIRADIGGGREADMVSYDELRAQDRTAATELRTILHDALSRGNLDKDQPTRCRDVLERLEDNYFASTPEGDLVYDETVTNKEVVARRFYFRDQALSLGLRVVDGGLRVEINDPRQVLGDPTLARMMSIMKEQRKFTAPFLEENPNSLPALQLAVNDVVSDSGREVSKRPLIALAASVGKVFVRRCEQGMNIERSEENYRGWGTIRRAAEQFMESGLLPHVNDLGEEYTDEHEWLRVHILENFARGCATDCGEGFRLLCEQLPLAGLLGERVGTRFKDLYDNLQHHRYNENPYENAALARFYGLVSILYGGKHYDVQIIGKQRSILNVIRRYGRERFPESMSEVMALFLSSMYLSYPDMDIEELELMVDDVCTNWPEQVEGELRYNWKNGENPERRFETGLSKVEIMRYIRNLFEADTDRHDTVRKVMDSYGLAERFEELRRVGRE